MADPIITTKAGLEDLKKELQERLTIIRDKISDEIARAREQGDLSENAAYSAALESKQFNEARILELEKLIQSSVIKTTNKSDRFAGLGEKVTIKRERDGKEFAYTLVGENESNPQEGKISIKSPIGKALMGKAEKQKVKIKLATGDEEYTILKIS